MFIVLCSVIEIIPAILTDSSVKFKDLVLRLEPYTRRVHVDIADGEFVPNKTISGYDELKTIESASKFDIHLMVSRPQDVLKEWFYTHADRFIIHTESEGIAECIKIINEQNRKVILALNPETSIDKLEQYLFGDSPVQSRARPPQADESPGDRPGEGSQRGTSVGIASGAATLYGIQFMTVHPGFQGGEFVKEVVDKIMSFRKKYPDIMIMCDGAITPETAPMLVKAGVSALVSGSYIVKSQDIEKAIRKLKEVTSD